MFLHPGGGVPLITDTLLLYMEKIKMLLSDLSLIVFDDFLVSNKVTVNVIGSCELEGCIGTQRKSRGQKISGDPRG